jgi:glycopeptide antibiotics resistance protein
MKSLSKTALALYLLILVWLVLFKVSFDFSSVLLGHQMRSLSLIPFADSLRGETISNFVVFIPLGLLLSVNLKRVTVLRKLAYIFILSVAVEVIQFILAIGVTDITDVITNTFGGFVGLLLYNLFNKYVDSKKLDRFIVIACMILLVVFMLLRLLVFRVRY